MWVSIPGFRFSTFGFRFSVFGFRFLVFAFRVSGFGMWGFGRVRGSQRLPAETAAQTLLPRGLIFKVHRLLSLNSRLESNKEEEEGAGKVSTNSMSSSNSDHPNSRAAAINTRREKRREHVLWKCITWILATWPAQ